MTYQIIEKKDKPYNYSEPEFHAITHTYVANTKPGIGKGVRPHLLIKLATQKIMFVLIISGKDPRRNLEVAGSNDVYRIGKNIS